jgi:hypothetical protein
MLQIDLNRMIHDNDLNDKLSNRTYGPTECGQIYKQSPGSFWEILEMLKNSLMKLINSFIQLNFPITKC